MYFFFFFFTCCIKLKTTSSNFSLLFAAPPKPSLNVSLMCSVKSVRADLQWEVNMYNTEKYAFKYTLYMRIIIESVDILLQLQVLECISR